MYTYETLLAAVVENDPARESRKAVDPATDEIIGLVPRRTVAELDEILDRAAAAQRTWAALPESERSAYLHRAADKIEENAEALAELLSREQGKPLDGPNARFEVGGCAAWLRAAADTPLPVEVLVDDESGYAEMHYRPIGVIGAISPWNWPLMISIWQIAPSLRMGNTVVLKPADSTALSVLALGKLLNEVLPADVVTIVPGSGSTIGDALSRSPKVGKLMFTGSTEVGQQIIEASAANVTPLTLELGGNDAGIVLPDADPAAIAEGLFWGAFINTGQTCAALKRLYVHDSIYEAVVEQLTAFASQMPMGNGLTPGNVLGPLHNRAQFDFVDSLVEQAKTAGATVNLGGNPDREAPGNFYPTTIVSDIDPHHPLVTEEQFGPALPIVRYSDVDEAIRLANELDFALGSSVWSSSRENALAVAARLQAGTTWINSHGGLHPMVPFGGAKKSGYGREFGVAGLKAVAIPHVISGR